MAEHVDQTLYASEFTQTEYDAMMLKLEDKFNKETLYRDKLPIKAAIQTYFAQTLQKVSVQFQGNEITVEKTHDIDGIDDAKDKRLHQLKLKLLTLKASLAEYKKDEWLIEFSETVRQEIFEYTKEIYSTEYLNRELIRDMIRIVFDINVKDIIFFIKGKIFIRHFKERDASEALNFSDEEVRTCIEKFFSGGILEEIKEGFGEVLYDKLNFSHINLKVFMRTYLRVFTSYIDIIVINLIPDERCRSMHNAIATVLLKENIDEMLILCMQSLMHYVGEQNKNAIEFVNAIEEGVDKTPPKKRSILDAEGMMWHCETMMPVAKQHNYFRKQVGDIENNILQKKLRLESITKELNAAKKELLPLEEKKERFEQEVIRKEKEKFDYNSPSREELNLTLSRFNKEIDMIKKKHKVAQNEHDQLLRKIENKEREITGWKNQLQSESEHYKHACAQNKTTLDTFNRVVKALTKAIAQR